MGSAEALCGGERDEDIRRISPHYHFKCSGSEADEGGSKRIKGEQAREEEREQVGFRVQRHGSQT